ncbi:membrane protein insertion efficiency factor YidD [candidate division WOR-3 bacterium]|nr:membrane protein insertion efficiency factor YidD [candidate division WOR-3 bacterium]
MFRIYRHSKKRSRVFGFRRIGEAIDRSDEKSRIGLTTKVIVQLIEFYRVFVSPIFPPSCRYTPTCSEYSKLAFLKYGVLKGAYLSIKRILRCNPFFPGGYDPLE